MMRTLALSIVLVVAPRCIFADGSCPSLENPPRIAEYVRKAARLPGSTTVQLTSSAPEGNSCYRRLEFSISGQTAPLVLFLAPDQRFLAPQIFDTYLDPEKAEAAKAAETAAKIKSYLAEHPRPSLGPKEAPITIAAFADFQCPFCRRTMLEITKQFAASRPNGVQIVYLSFPLPGHAWARAAAEAAACLGASDAFWRAHDFIFEHQSEMKADTISDTIYDFVSGLDTTDNLSKFKNCVRVHETASTIDADFALAQSLGVTSTPTLFVNGRSIVGVQSPAQVANLISGKTP
jgi:protein-disulfide isomerase